MLLPEKLGEAVLLLSLVALCTAGQSRFLNSLVSNADDALKDSSTERDDINDLQSPKTAKSSTTGSPRSSGPQTTYIYSHYQLPSHAYYPYAYGSFAYSPVLYNPYSYNYGLHAMTTPNPYPLMAGYHPYSAMNPLYSFHPMPNYYPYSAMNSFYGYRSMPNYYPYSAMNSFYGFHPMPNYYPNSAMNSFYGFHPMPYYHPYSAMNSFYGFHPMPNYQPYSAMNSFYGFHPMPNYYPYSAMNSFYGFHPMPYYYPYSAMNSVYSYYPMVASNFHPAMNSFYPMVAPYHFPTMTPLNPLTNGSSPQPTFTAYTFHAPMAPYSFLRPHMAYSPLYSLGGASYYPMNSFHPYSAALMPFNSFHPPMYPVSYLHPHMGYPFVHPAMNTMNLMNPMYNLAHPMNAMNPYNLMNPISSFYNPMNLAYPFHPPMQVASYFLTPPLGASSLLPFNGYGQFHPAPGLLQTSQVAASPLSLPMHFPYSYQAGMYSPSYAAGFPGALGWNQFGGAAWNPYFAMGYGGYPQWPYQFAHMWPLHPYYQTVPSQEGVCSFDRPFQCWGTFTCVSIDAVCNNRFDCYNSADEDPRICIVGKRPAYEVLVSYLTLPDQQWLLQKLFNNVDAYTTAYSLRLATSLGDLRWSLALTDENINNTKTVMEAVKNGNKEPLLDLGMKESSWESVKFLFNSMLNTGFFLD